MTQALVDERTVEQLARRIAELGGRQRARVFHLSWWTDRLLAASMYDPEFRARLFRFVDAFPALKDDADIEAHLRDEFEGADVPDLVRRRARHRRMGARRHSSVRRRGEAHDRPDGPAVHHRHRPRRDSRGVQRALATAHRGDGRRAR